jgi:transposase-like protein
MSKKTRRRFSPEEKLRILRLHLLEQRPVSELCDEHGLHPTLFYQWQKSFFENGTAALQPRSRSRSGSNEKDTIAALHDKLRHKDEIIASVAEEMARLKKELGESSP